MSVIVAINFNGSFVTGSTSITWSGAYGDPRRLHDAIGEGLSCTLIDGTAHTRRRVDAFREFDGKMARMPALTERQRVAAYGVARRGDQVLLVRASSATGVPGTWWLPGGGLLFGESPAECLVREFMEETGQRPQVRHLLDVVSDVAVWARQSIRLHSVRLIYEVEVEPGPVRPEADGSTDAVRWVRTDDLGDMPLIPWLRMLTVTHLTAD
jgi:ADP-ribose pyrophosphatase YjhB (NUDIX family)